MVAWGISRWFFSFFQDLRWLVKGGFSYKGCLLLILPVQKSARKNYLMIGSSDIRPPDLVKKTKFQNTFNLMYSQKDFGIAFQSFGR